MQKHCMAIFILGTLFVSSLFFAEAVQGTEDLTAQDVQEILKDEVGFTNADLEKLEKGEYIVKEIKAKNKTEIAYAGAIKLEAPRDAVFAAFRRAVERQRRKLAEQHGFFKNPPTVKDLTKLKIKESEIRSLRDCEPGNCNTSLSSEYIQRFKEEIDWNAKDAEKKAIKLYKQIMVEHLAGYLENGNSALMDYNDDPEPLSLSEEQKSLLENLLWIDRFAPELKKYLEEYPHTDLEGIEELTSWEKLSIAFKDVIINSHGIFYKKDEDIPQGLIISKQIYANHFFHSSLSLTGIISFPKNADKYDTYLFFVNHTRAGALSGATGKLLSAAVDGEAENNLTTVLKDTRKYTAYELVGGEEPEFEEDSGMIRRLFANKFCIGIIVIVSILLAIILLTRRKEN